MVPLQHKEVEEGSKRERELQQLRSMRTVRDLELQKLLLGQLEMAVSPNLCFASGSHDADALLSSSAPDRPGVAEQFP